VYGGEAVKSVYSDTAIVAPNVPYTVGFEILRNDLGQAGEYVKNVLVDGKSLGECHPDGGDYDCTFFGCPIPNTTITSATGTVNLEMNLVGHSKDCDCDSTTWECSSELDAVAGRLPMSAVGRFCFTPTTTTTTTTALPVVVSQMVYGGEKAKPVYSGTAIVVPNVPYTVRFEILRNDLGQAGEYVKNVLVDGKSLGECHPDGGDYDCTFFECPIPNTTVTSATGTVNLEMNLVGHSKDCDCDDTTWECSSELDAVAGRLPMSAVGRFVFTP